MNAQLYKQAFKALFPRQGVYYFWLSILIAISVGGLPDSDLNFEYGYFLIAVTYFAFVTGSMLMDLLVKPLVFCMPMQRQILHRIVPILGMLYCILSALIFLVLIDTPVRVGSFTEFVSIAFLALTLFLLLVFAMLHTSSAAWLFLLLTALALAHGSGSVVSRLQTVVGFFSEHPLFSFLLAAGSTLVFGKALSRNLLRALCGKFFMSFTAMMNLNKAEESNVRLKQQKLRDKSYYRQRRDVDRGFMGWIIGRHGGLAVHVLHDFHTTSYGKNWYVTLFWLVSLSAMMLSGSDRNDFTPYFLLFFSVFLVLSELSFLFKKRFSPLLPVSRATFFKEAVCKSVVQYLLAISIVAAELLIFRLLFWLLPETMNTAFAPFNELSGKLVFYFALIAPLSAWASTTLHSLVTIVPFAVAFSVFFMIITYYLIEPFLQLGALWIALITLLVWLPFLLRNYYLSFKTDLVM